MLAGDEITDAKDGENGEDGNDDDDVKDEGGKELVSEDEESEV